LSRAGDHRGVENVLLGRAVVVVPPELVHHVLEKTLVQPPITAAVSSLLSRIGRLVSAFSLEDDVAGIPVL
jgi:hypothetical protein